MPAVRLSKRLAELGVCSRREADRYIEQGWVLVDGQVAVLGTKVFPQQKIEVHERAYAAQMAQVTILLNKPLGYVSGQAEHGYTPADVLITQANRWQEDRSPIRFSPFHRLGLAPAGRLDIDSTGLLVLTQDGRIAKQLIGENTALDKEYLVRVSGKLIPNGLSLLTYGLSLDGKPLKPARVAWQNKDQLRFILREGKKRQIRRMCELVGLHVIGLKRIRIGNIRLGKLPPGQWRYLSPGETFG